MRSNLTWLDRMRADGQAAKQAGKAPTVFSTGVDKGAHITPTALTYQEKQQVKQAEADGKTKKTDSRWWEDAAAWAEGKTMPARQPVMQPVYTQGQTPTLPTVESAGEDIAQIESWIGDLKEKQRQTGGAVPKAALKYVREHGTPEQIAEWEAEWADKIGAYDDVQKQIDTAKTMLTQLKGEDEWSFAKSLAGAVQKGVGRFIQLGGDTAAFAEDILAAPFEIVGGQPLGELSDTMIFNRIAADNREINNRINSYYQENMEKGGALAWGIEELGSAAVTTVPQAITAIVTAGGSIVAQTTEGLIQAAGRAVAPGFVTMLTQTVGNMMRDPQYWLAFFQVVGSSYEEALADQREMEQKKEAQALAAGEKYTAPENENMMRLKAGLYAIGNGLMNAAVEVGSGIQTLPDELQKGTGLWWAWVNSTFDEGQEGTVQGVLARGLKNIFYDAGNPLFSLEDENAIINPGTIAKDWAGDAIVGGILSGGQIAAGKVLGRSPNTQIKGEQAQKTAPGEGAGKYRATRPQNVDMPTVPIINLSIKDIPDMPPSLSVGNSLRGAAIERARQRLGLDKRNAAYIPASNVTRDGNEYVLKITPTTLKKMLSPSDGGAISIKSIVVMDNLERIANNGVWFDGEGDRKGRAQIAGVDHLKTTVYIDGVPNEVDMRVRLLKTAPGKDVENVLYYFTPEEILSIEEVGTGSPTDGRHATHRGSETMPTSDIKMPQPGDGVKPEFAQDGAVDTNAGPGIEQQGIPQQAQQARTERQQQVERAVKAAELGEQGAMRAVEFYDGERNPIRYMESFMAYYEAGANGTKINKVKAKYARALTEGQRFAAYLAGQLDAGRIAPGETTSVEEDTPRELAVDGQETVDKMKDAGYNEDEDKQEFERYRTLLGDSGSLQSFDDFWRLKYGDPEGYSELKTDFANKQIQQHIQSTPALTTLLEGRQGKHILGHNNFIPGRSYLIVTVEEVRELVKKYAGTGEIKRDSKGEWTHKEFVVADHVIGYIVPQDGGEPIPTKRFCIHYAAGKDKGVHIVPAKED